MENNETLEEFMAEIEKEPPYDEESRECWQCYCMRQGRQHTNGPCRCKKVILPLDDESIEIPLKEYLERKKSLERIMEMLKNR